MSEHGFLDRCQETPRIYGFAGNRNEPVLSTSFDKVVRTPLLRGFARDLPRIGRAWAMGREKARPAAIGVGRVSVEISGPRAGSPVVSPRPPKTLSRSAASRASLAMSSPIQRAGWKWARIGQFRALPGPEWTIS
ncbi:hypothetical protein MacB4_00695 [Methylacidimicrobium sp. B4]|nr:hypothetical protein MacB4_00695 [Methylacidimicrobium sp. B4]